MDKKKMLFLSLLVMLLWGSLFPMVKMGYAAFGVVTTADILFFAGVRFTVCGALICLYCMIKDRRTFVPVKSTLLPVLLSGVFAIILHYSFTYMGLKLTDSSKTAILKQIGVLFYVCFSALFFKDDRLTVKKLIGVLLGFAGIIAINVSTEGIAFCVGDALIIAASFCTVFSNVISKKVFDRVEPITATGVSQLFGGAVLLLAGKGMGGGMYMGWNASAWIMVYICIASIFGYCIWFWVVKRGELSKLFIIKFAEPVFASLFGALLLGENILKPQYLAAFLLIAAGITISNLDMKNRVKLGENANDGN